MLVAARASPHECVLLCSLHYQILRIVQKGWACSHTDKKEESVNLLSFTIIVYSCLPYMQCHVKSVQDLLYGILVSQVLIEVTS